MSHFFGVVLIWYLLPYNPSIDILVDVSVGGGLYFKQLVCKGTSSFDGRHGTLVRFFEMNHFASSNWWLCDIVSFLGFGLS